MNAQQTRTVRRARAGQPVSEGTTSAQTILRSVPVTSETLTLHRVDTQYITDSHARVVAGKYEQRPMPIDVAEADAYDLRGQEYEDEQDDIGIGWLVFAVVCILAFFAFGLYINFVHVL